jgi:hypothetical protein
MFLFYCFHIFIKYLRFFLVKRHKTFFGFGFQILFFGYTFFFDFGFWLSVRNGLYFVFGFVFLYIFYFILATRLASPFIRSSPFYLPPYFIWSPPFIQSIKTKSFLFIIHSLLLLLLLQVVVVRRLFVPAKMC